MPASGISLVDPNVWLAIAFSDHQHHAKGQQWFNSQADRTCAFCRVTQLALLRHLTNSHIMGKFVRSQRDAWKVYDQLANDPRFVFLSEPPSLDSSFRQFTQSTSPSHQGWTDAYLAAFAIAGELTLVTTDHAFHAFERRGLELEIIETS